MGAQLIMPEKYSGDQIKFPGVLPASLFARKRLSAWLSSWTLHENKADEWTPSNANDIAGVHWLASDGIQ
jgi:hypothetical protein